MKAVLLVDLPESCEDCPYLGQIAESHVKACFLTETWFWEDELIDGRSVICPLRPLPKKEEKPIKGEDDYNDFCIGYTRGWNECLEAITGETE